MSEVKINYGALASPIEEQLNEQGYTLGEKVEFIEKLYKAYIMCMFHLFTDSQRDSILKKLHNKIMDNIKPI